WLRLRENASATIEATILGFADPRFPVQVTQEANDRGWVLPSALGPLPHSREEVEDVVARFGGASRAFVGQAASEAVLKGLDLAPFGILHFATHAFSNQERPARSAVLLAP